MTYLGHAIRDEGTMEDKMFKPNAKIRKLLADADAAYVFRDGVIIKDRKTVGNGNYKASAEVYYIVPCEIDFYVGSRGPSSTQGHTDQGLTVYDPKVLIHGLRTIELWWNNKSDAMKERGIICDSITLITPHGGHFDIDIYDFITSQVKPFQGNNHYKSMLDMAEALKREYEKVIELKP